MFLLSSSNLVLSHPSLQKVDQNENFSPHMRVCVARQVHINSLNPSLNLGFKETMTDAQ